MHRAQAQSSGEGGLLSGCPLQGGDRGGVRAAVRSAASTPGVRGRSARSACRGWGCWGLGRWLGRQPHGSSALSWVPGGYLFPKIVVLHIQNLVTN